MNCKNCGNIITGDFCGNCGQKSKSQRINFSYLVGEIPNSIFQLNRGFFYTVKELLFRPGHTIREFLLGKRVQHYKPIGFLLLTTTIYVVTYYFLEKETFFYDMIGGMMEGAEAKDNPIDSSYLDFLHKYQIYLPLVILPLFSFSTYLAFSKSKYNYFEHLVINIYITGQQMLIYLLLGFLFYVNNFLIMTPLLIGFTYNVWTFNQVFNEKKLLTKVGLILLSYLIFIVLVTLIGVIIAIYYIKIK